MLKWSTKVLVCLLSLLVFCKAAPLPSSAAFGDFTIEDEIALGDRFNALMHSRLDLIRDPVVTEHVEGIMQRLKAAAPSQPFEIEVFVIADDSVNAFAAPAGNIYVHSGLIKAMQSEAELAAVMAHELAHVTERHLAANIERQPTINLLTMAGVLAGVMLSGAGGAELGQALAVGSMAGGQAAALKYSRDDEREADHLGLQYLAGAGYDPEAKVGAFQRIQRQKRMSGAGSPPPYMSTHPGVEDRIDYIRDMALRMQRQDKLDTPDSLSFQQVQVLLWSRYSDPRSARNYLENRELESCLTRLGQGIVASRGNEMQLAREMLIEEDSCAEDSFLWQRELGRFHFAMGRFDQASLHLDRAMEMHSGDYLARFYKARILRQEGEVQEARNALQEVLDHVPRDPRVREELGRVSGRSGDEFTGYLHYAYASMYRNQRENTERYAEKARQLARTPAQQEELGRFEDQFSIWREYWEEM